MHQVFEVPVRIRFGDCDPAGIVYHPRYFSIFNGVVEDFFRDVVQCTFEQCLEKDLGFPVVGIHCDFVKPTRVGELCIAKLWIERLGNSSVRYAMTLEKDGEMRVKLTETAVCVNRDGIVKAKPLPDFVRMAMKSYAIETESQSLSFRC